MKRDSATNGNIIQAQWKPEQMVMTAHDKEILRELAKRLQALANRPQEDEKKKLWTAHNDLQAVRPMIFFDAENGWNEIFAGEVKTLQCTGEMAQDWEMWLHKELIYAEKLRDDKPLDAIFYVPYCTSDSGWGIDKTIIGDPEHGEAYTWESPITDEMMEEDVDMSTIIKKPELHVDADLSEQYYAIACDVFDGILEVQRRHWWFWSLELTHPYSDLRGMENMMYDFYDYPEKVHEIMNLFYQGHMHRIDYLEQNHVMMNNVGNCYIGSGGLGFTNQLQAEPVSVEQLTTKLLWGHFESQETSEVSTEMFAEFVLPYQIKMASRYGLNYYGCCEGLDKRWDAVKKIPNLRRLSVSQWADFEKMSEILGSNYVNCYKCSPTDLAVPHMDEDHIRENLRRVFEHSKRNGNHLELLMKDNHTLANKPENAYRWVEIVREEIARAYE